MYHPVLNLCRSNSSAASLRDVRAARLLPCCSSAPVVNVTVHDDELVENLETLNSGWRFGVTFRSIVVSFEC